MLPQQELIQYVVEVCHKDLRIEATLQYGSFTQSEGDTWSDIEFWLFVEDLALPTLHKENWIQQIANVLLCFQNESGAHVAIFENLIRGEFHFAPVSAIEQIRTWSLADEKLNIEAMIVLDRKAKLRRELELINNTTSKRYSTEHLQSLQEGFMNWFLFGLNLLARGEFARALDILPNIQRYLLWMLRHHKKKDEHHYLTPSKKLEQDLSPENYQHFALTSARLEPTDLRRAYSEAWYWYLDLQKALERTYGIESHPILLEKLQRRVKRELIAE